MRGLHSLKFQKLACYVTYIDFSSQQFKIDNYYVDHEGAICCL